MPAHAGAAGSLLRVACEGGDVGAEVYVDGKFGGECPIDVQVGEGMVSLRVVKKLDAERERSFERQFRVGDGTIKKVDAVLSAPRLNPEAQSRLDERQRVERAEAQRREQARQLALAEATQRDQARAQAGDASAMSSLADRYATGDGVPRDDQEALAWYRRAVDAGDARAMTALARRFERGPGATRDFAQALALYRRAGEAGDAEAMYELGVIDQLGVGGKMDDVQAAAWFRRAAEAGSSKAANEVGKAFLWGRQVAKDPAQAIAWFRRSADAGDGMFWLYHIYNRGYGVPVDEAAAEPWLRKAAEAYRKAADRGDADAMASLAALQSTPADETKSLRQHAIERYLQAAKGGDVRAMSALAGVYYGAQNYVEAARWHRAAAEAGMVHSMVMMALFHGTGQGVAKNEAEETKWRRKAAERGDATSANYLKALNKW